MTPSTAPSRHEIDSRQLQKIFSLPAHWGAARMTPRRVQNYLSALAEHAAGATVLRSLPVKLTVESTNICNLRCPACPTGRGLRGRAPGHMPVELFEWLLRELGPTLLEVELHNWGEPLLGKNVFDLIRTVSAAGVASTVSTNFSIPFDEQRAERLVESGLSTLGVSIDGATQAAYEQYRVRGDIALVLRNCRLMADAKRRLGSHTPRLIYSFHAFAHNVHEVDAARRAADDLGMEFAATRGWVEGAAPEGLEQFPYGWGEGFPDRCFFLWFQAVVHHDTGVAPCCCTFHQEDDLAQVDPASFDRLSFRDVWNGPGFVTARGLFEERAGGADARKMACFDCPETKDFEAWREVLRTHDPTFRRTSSNDLFNYFFNRRPDLVAKIVPLRRHRRD